MNDQQAQARADRVRAFQAELAVAESAGVLTLSDEQRAGLAAYHARTLEELARAFDVDVSARQKQLSWGMRIVAFLGAAAMSAAVYFLFYRYWGFLGPAVQTTVLVLAPMLGVAAAHFAAAKDRSGYFATIVALVTLACFIVDLVMLGDIFSITPSQNAFLAWAVFALLLAYSLGLRLLQIAGILCLLGYLALSVGTWGGCYWLSAGRRPENFIFAGAGIACLSLAPHRRLTSFPGTYRLFGLLAVFVAILVLGNWGESSRLPLPARTVEHLYQVSGFLLAGGVTWVGVRRRWPGLTNLGSTWFAVFLYTKFFDWWWEWMPRYLFFLVLGLVAVLLLLVLKRLRAATPVVTP